ncbi:MAG: T9SS type A sorting domain-containing protein, partial [candidate division KSB1 bacterium]|nr:T9SS type A sorting domain-containing protein [candidate division KSB1 bacterium]
VVWPVYQNNGAGILGQSVSHFPDAEACARGFKPQGEADTLTSVVLLDQKGKPADTGSWKTWPDFPICTDPYNQEYNGIDYNQQDGTFLTVWNDYRGNQWDGSWGSEPNWYPPPADIYGQRMRVMPHDTLFTLVDESGNPGASPLINTTISGSEANEGMFSYPVVTYGMHANEFCIAYRYAGSPEQSNIHAAFFNGKSTIPEEEPDTRVSANASVVSFTLHQNYPNPFNPNTEIRLALSRSAPVRLSIYNSLGQLVTVLCDRLYDAGDYRLSWNGTDYENRPVSGGIYFCRLESDTQVKTIKMALIK